MLSFGSVGRVPKPTNMLLTDSPNNGMVPSSANLDSPIGLGGFAKRKEFPPGPSTVTWHHGVGGDFLKWF